MKNKKPNLFIVGVQKSGTTSFYNWLANNDDIVTGSYLKDNHTLFKDNANTIYQHKFSGTGKYYLDASVNYFFYHDEFIERTDHSEKVLLFLRNPIKRVLSAYNYNYMKGRESKSLEEALNYIWSDRANYKINYFNSNFTYVEHGLYYQGIKSLRHKLGSNLKIYLLEEIVNNEQLFIKDISSFLNIKLDNNIEKYNKSKNIRSFYISKFFNNRNKFKDFLKNHVDNEKLKKIANTIININYRQVNKHEYKLDKKLYDKLYEFYIKDINKTSDILNKDLKKIWFK